MGDSRLRRRDLLAALGVAAVAPPLILVELSSAEQSERGRMVAPERRWGMVIDVAKCIGCFRCVEACREENGFPIGKEGTQVRFVGYKYGRPVWLPLLCFHCSEPPCVHVCPTGASYKRADGIVLVDYRKCVGCHLCVWACPYEERFWDERKDYPIKCVFCYRRVDKGEVPACVEACPNRVRVFGDLNDPNSEPRRLLDTVPPERVLVLRGELRLGPSVVHIKP